MNGSIKKVLRCAIYTRKSTEHNLDLEFNSLDAQREACEAYIKSQAHEGWRPIPDRYDDGAFSGASLDRPDLQKLLAEVRAGKIDIIVVYKVDRLTRSLADFAKLVELFDQHSVSFVSVTQSFNTTSSMGRLTLNVLLSFAQFEREVIGERVRDKIAASKRKGIWVGGPVPLGYANVDKKLVVVPEEAETVRSIYSRYLELGSIGALVAELDRTGVRTKRRPGAKGGMAGGFRFGVGALAYLLKNRLYVGEMAYRGELHRGEHDPIVERSMFDAVQAKLAAGAVERRLRLKASPALLAGRIFDDRGNRMSPTHSVKRGARYRYYVSRAFVQQRRDDVGSVVRAPAPEVENMVLTAVRRYLEADGREGKPIVRDDRDLVERYVVRVVVNASAIEVQVVAPTAQPVTESDQHGDGMDRDADNPGPITITLPWVSKNFTAVKGVIHAPADDLTLNTERREALLRAISKARCWIDDLVTGHGSSFAEIAARERKVERLIRMRATLAFTSPRIVTAIIDGSAPADLTVTRLATSLPLSWAEQERQIKLHP